MLHSSAVLIRSTHFVFIVFYYSKTAGFGKVGPAGLVFGKLPQAARAPKPFCACPKAVLRMPQSRSARASKPLLYAPKSGDPAKGENFPLSAVKK